MEVLPQLFAVLWAVGQRNAVESTEKEKPQQQPETEKMPCDYATVHSIRCRPTEPNRQLSSTRQ